MATNNAGERGPDYIEQRDPDLMNDPQYATNTGTSEDGNGEADTCRICRGEASEQEPLFYPCKCSGSIKFVHQDCLMEWLSHSQKKHCELCKTPFRFTKLYSPNMPQNLPTHVFLRHLAIHAVKNLAIWLRFCLVVFVWLGCLPWAMRHVWGFLFWFGDGGWTSKDVGPRLPYNDTARTLEMITKAREHLDILIGNGTSPATPLLSSPTTAATVGAVLNRLPALLSPMVRFFNLSAVGEPFPFGSLKDLYHGVGFRSSGPLVNNTNTMHVMGQYRLHTPGHTSLLSEVRFLKGLTRHPGFNRVIITTLEGQIITIVVVVCFVLVFLIREWVVQQQPGINMGAGFNAEFAAVERPPRNRNVLPDNAPDAEGFPADMGRNVDEFLHDVEQRQAVDVAARPIARPRRRMVRFEDGGGNDTMPAQEDRENAVPPVPSNNVRERADAGEGPAGSSNQQRPRILARDALSPAAEIQRQLAEDSSSMHERFDVAEFVSLWRRAGGNPEEVLKLLEEDGLGEKLRYWKNAMRQLQARSGPPAQDGSKSAGDPVSPDGATPKVDALYGDGHDSNSENWADIPSPNDERLRDMHLTTLQENQSNNSSSSSNKGKEKVVDTLAEPLGEVSNRSTPGLVSTTPRQSLASEETTWNHTSYSREAVAFSSGPGRPRAVSDGPQPRANTSPLAQSYWSFSNLPETSSHNTPISFSYTYMSGEPNTEAMPDNCRGIPHDQNSSSDVSSASVSDILFQGASENIEVFSPDSGTTQRANSWDEVFANNPVPGSEDDFEEHPVDEGNEEQNPFHPDGLLPQDVPVLENREAAPVHHNEPQGILGNIANFLWGGVNVDRDGPVGDDEHIVQDIAAEAPFVPVAHLQGPNIFDDDEGADEVVVNQDGDVVAAALAAGLDPNDPDGLDDVEDFEGIMELVGMRGPLTALIQNGLFSAVLISLTVACGVWVPYNLGRLVLLLIANPVAAIKLPLRFLFSFAAVLQDLALVAVGALSYLLIQICSLPRYLFSFTATGPTFSSIANQSSLGLGSLRFARTAGQRIIEGIVNAALQIPDSEVPAFSAVSHESLLHIKAIITNTIQYIGSTITSRLASRTIESASVTSIDSTAVWAVASRHGIKALQLLQRLPAVLTTTESWVISLDMPPRVVPVDPSLSYWSGLDRFWAILTGYIAFSFLGAAYLKKGSPFSTSQVGREWEATIIDVLNQAGGVMKVILIIGIEMLVFPLYCGLLLDLALLPLFDNATILSRVLFTIGSPLTSIFVHWFVGTCYMFHFALFVSMCRKIMRTGVLYFIRDPDDPNFHPVRDVLERSVATQLRKITFSAMVYGALVVICLGGVVWGLAFAFAGVLPIHWSSNEPVLEFPIDLLFYNFFMPLAVKFFKPSDGLHAMYAWWFRKCARILRLTWFLFDERKLDEEGHHVRRSWAEVFKGLKGDATNPIKPGDEHDPFQKDPSLPAYFLRDGRFVRAPASDQVRIPKGGQVFLEIDEDNKRIDGRPESENGVHGRNSEHFKMVYIPPHFRGRIFLFIMSIWLFAAVTGVCVTIVPLVFGRHIFAKIIPTHVQKNDVYAFSIGIYILGSALYCIMHIQRGVEWIRRSLAIDAETPTKVLRKTTSMGLRIFRVFYAYTALLIVLPSLFALAVEFYFIIPLHTYLAVSEPHVIHFVQSWTLGLLYVKLSTRLILWHADSRPAEALRAVMRDGYFDPDIKIATRAFIFPVTTILVAALLIPATLASVANRYNVFGPGEEQKILAFRYAYPLCLSFLINATGTWMLLGVMKGWRMRIRDEVYLIGERLHNFGDRSKSGTAALIPTGNRLET